MMSCAVLEGFFALAFERSGAKSDSVQSEVCRLAARRFHQAIAPLLSVAPVSSGRTEIKGFRVSIRRKGRTCVGSFAQANVQRPRVKEAERVKGETVDCGRPVA